LRFSKDNELLWLYFGRITNNVVKIGEQKDRKLHTENLKASSHTKNRLKKKNISPIGQDRPILNKNTTKTKLFLGFRSFKKHFIPKYGNFQFVQNLETSRNPKELKNTLYHPSLLLITTNGC